MKIAIDINGLFASSGIGSYLRLLIENLLSIDGENEYFLFACLWRDFHEKVKRLSLPTRANVRLILHRFPESVALVSGWMFNIRVQEAFLAPYRIDLFHGTATILPKLRRPKSVLTVHHVKGSISDPSPWKNYYFKSLTSKAITAADHIIADSMNTRNDVLKWYGIPDSKVSVIYPGRPSEVYRRIERIDGEITRKCGLQDNYILFVGPVNDRKNLLRTLDAFVRLKKEGTALKLVVAGEISGEYGGKVKEKCLELHLTDDVIFTGRLTTGELAYLYTKAALFIYPSLFEGFGYPPLEAMACGCPVVASNVTSIPEIVADAAVLIDPHDTKAIAEAMKRVLNDKYLRDELISRGYERVREFSWETTARKTLEIYNKTASGR